MINKCYLKRVFVLIIFCSFFQMVCQFYFLILGKLIFIDRMFKIFSFVVLSWIWLNKSFWLKNGDQERRDVGLFVCWLFGMFCVFRIRYVGQWLFFCICRYRFWWVVFFYSCGCFQYLVVILFFVFLGFGLIGFLFVNFLILLFVGFFYVVYICRLFLY